MESPFQTALENGFRQAGCSRKESSVPLKILRVTVAREVCRDGESCTQTVTRIVFYFVAGVTLTAVLASASLPPANTTRLNVTFAVRFVVVKGWLAAITKL